MAVIEGTPRPWRFTSRASLLLTSVATKPGGGLDGTRPVWQRLRGSAPGARTRHQFVPLNGLPDRALSLGSVHMHRYVPTLLAAVVSAVLRSELEAS